MESREIAKLAYKSMDEKKAININIIDIRELSVIADYFLIAGANNERQVKALAEDVENKLAKAGVTPKSIEGFRNANWILMDYGDVIIHIFNQEQRLFFDLERIWTNGTGSNIIAPEDL